MLTAAQQCEEYRGVTDTTEDPFVSDRSAGSEGGGVSRIRVVKTIATAILGGVLGMFARSTDSEAATRRILWAVINADGARKRGKGVTASNRVSTGEYEIRFERNVDTCAYSVTMDHNSGYRVHLALGSRHLGTHRGRDHDRQGWRRSRHPISSCGELLTAIPGTGEAA